MHWRRWGRPTTVGRGKGLINDCTPYCANGTFYKLPIKVRLYARHHCNQEGLYGYTRVSWRFFGPLPFTALRRAHSIRTPCEWYSYRPAAAALSKSPDTAR